MSIDLSAHGLRKTGRVFRNLSTAALYEEALRRGEAVLGDRGQLVVNTSPHTGRLPNDKFIVREPASEQHVGWGAVNKAFDADRFEALKRRVIEHLERRDALFVQDAFGGADPEYRLPIRVVTENAWHALFAKTMFVRPARESDVADHKPEFTILHAPTFEADPARDGTHSSAFIIANLGQKTAIIGGTKYAGEIKKTIFSVLNYVLPLRGVMSMHCSANIGEKGDVALFFGLSGTGKTTLSADPDRRLIGDDEHGWSDRGVFNFEGGCYAKTIRLSAKAEPEIYAASTRFGSVLENVIYDEASRAIDFDRDTITENTRSAYPLEFIPNAEPSAMGGHAQTIIMLTADASGIMPPIARLNAEQAMYHFLSGYTAKVAGTEKGVKEPKFTFSTCFGAPFMTLPPSVYAKLLGEKISKHKARCWLVNTGWTGGPYGIGQRMSIAHTRALVRGALDGSLANVPFSEDPIFGVAVPQRADGVPSNVLQPRNTWKDPREYDAKAHELAHRFTKNFEAFASMVPPAVRDAGPRPQRVG
jgi:phosphoenolpyruvate carboxykinase (ATP)